MTPHPHVEHKRLLSAHELARELGVGRTTAYALLWSGAIPSMKVGRLRKVRREDLLDAMDRIYPSSVFLDGKKLAGSVFKGMIKRELGLPIKHPRPKRIDDPDE